jgi:hypothetical protein
MGIAIGQLQEKLSSTIQIAELLSCNNADDLTVEHLKTLAEHERCNSDLFHQITKALLFFELEYQTHKASPAILRETNIKKKLACAAFKLEMLTYADDELIAPFIIAEQLRPEAARAGVGQGAGGTATETRVIPILPHLPISFIRHIDFIRQQYKELRQISEHEDQPEFTEKMSQSAVTYLLNLCVIEAAKSEIETTQDTREHTAIHRRMSLHAKKADGPIALLWQEYKESTLIEFPEKTATDLSSDDSTNDSEISSDDNNVTDRTGRRNSVAGRIFATAQSNEAIPQDTLDCFQSSLITAIKRVRKGKNYKDQHDAVKAFLKRNTKLASMLIRLTTIKVRRNLLYELLQPCYNIATNADRSRRACISRYHLTNTCKQLCDTLELNYDVAKLFIKKLNNNHNSKKNAMNYHSQACFFGGLVGVSRPMKRHEPSTLRAYKNS